MEKWSVESKTRAAFAGVALVLLLVIVGVAVTMQTFIESSRGVWRATEMSSTRERVYSALVDAISSQRTYAVTGQDKYLHTRNEAVERLQTYLHELRDQARRFPSSVQERENELERTVHTLIGMLDESRQLRETRAPAALRMTLSTRIQEELTATRVILTELDGAQAKDLALRLDADDRAATLLYAWLAAIAIVMFITLAWLSRRIADDLRERRSVEDRLQEANRFLESLLENIPMMIFAKDAQTLRMVRLNGAGEKLLGIPRADLIGKSDFDVFPPAQAKFFSDKDHEVLAYGDVVDIPEEEVDTPHRGQRILHTRKVPIRDAAGRPQFLLGISIDITEEKATERRILALNEELRRHTDLLQSSNRELESFCYSVSHDLRAPLRAINGFSRLLEQEFTARLDGEAPRYLRTICNASERMGRLIDDLLEFSRIGRQVLERDTTDMRRVVDRVVIDVLSARDLPAPRIDIGLLPQVRCDRRLMHLVWLNLLENAVKYSTASRDPCITIGAETGEYEITYWISDNGIGFDMRYYDKLFGVFQRLHADASYPGTGVGLAIAQRIVARHGGRIWAQGEPGKGATFYFALPTSVEAASRLIDNVERES